MVSIDFPDRTGPFDRLEEQLELITGLWDTPVGEPAASGSAHPDSPMA
jgi:hypothetical protein